MLQPANTFSTEWRVWFLLDGVVAYDEARDIALRQGRGQRRAGRPARYFLWSHWLRSEQQGRDREQLGSVTGATLAEAISRANKRLEAL